MKRADVVLAPSKEAPSKEILYVAPQHDCNFKKCEVAINIGMFFDGTNNNMDKDSKSSADSNIARLHNIYSNDDTNYHRFYIPGVGTKFSDIGEYSTSSLGAGCAMGCEGRVIYGLLSVFNIIHRRSFQTDMFDKDSILALCRNSHHVSDSNDRESLSKIGAQNGLLQRNIGSASDRQEFLIQQAKRLEKKLKNAQPRIVECFLDVFGFSRGAAEARVFCHWLDALLINGQLGGVQLRFRFLGIMDTVASAGFWSGVSAFVKSSTGGHGAWASAESLSIPQSVQNCVHMVAMHELRRNFPLDEIGTGGKLKAGWIQYAYPGSHSDVGGGYRPGELGISVGDDSLKLSQIPLNHMFECAVAAGAPMKRLIYPNGAHDPLAIHPELMKAFNDFLSESTLTPRPVFEWLQPYINWRWQVRDDYYATNQVKKSNFSEKMILQNFNDIFISDARAIARSTGNTRAVYALVERFNIAKRSTPEFDPEAPEVYALAQRAKPTPNALIAMFDGYVHDSLAGFNSPLLEMSGYWRYRKVFLGSDQHVIAENQQANAVSNIA